MERQPYELPAHAARVIAPRNVPAPAEVNRSEPTDKSCPAPRLPGEPGLGRQRAQKISLCRGIIVAGNSNIGVPHLPLLSVNLIIAAKELKEF
jgi:hypothetical protein